MLAVAYYLQTIKDQLNEKREAGATVVEYALVIGGISILLVLGAAALNTGLTAFWNSVSAYLLTLVP